KEIDDRYEERLLSKALSLKYPPAPLVFFFSSRRRHTRSYGDWSSDVCSSDLRDCRRLRHAVRQARARPILPLNAGCDRGGRGAEIGRASCRERVEMWVVVGGVKKNNVEESKVL